MLCLCYFLILLGETMKNKSPHARGGYVGPIESRARLMLEVADAARDLFLSMK